MSKIPTAKEFLDTKSSLTNSQYMRETLIEFAKLHVKGALEEAAKDVDTQGLGVTPCVKIKQSILNAYPETNIV